MHVILSPNERVSQKCFRVWYGMLNNSRYQSTLFSIINICSWHWITIVTQIKAILIASTFNYPTYEIWMQCALSLPPGNMCSFMDIKMNSSAVRDIIGACYIQNINHENTWNVNIQLRQLRSCVFDNLNFLILSILLLYYSYWIQRNAVDY